ncbi:MAG TPA: ATP-grasp domain-containing protein [Burkholderiales bacterium]|nr:ATP-grasp domain-containing protein [Burkholderiales bacterium]
MPASPDSAPLLIVSASARALACSGAKRAIAVVALDLFNDIDTRRYARASRAVAGRGLRFDAKRLLAAADDLCPPAGCAGFVYGSGLEGRPALIARLARSRRLYGNAPDTVRLVKEPARFFALLDALGVAHPEVRIEPPPDPADWLVKRAGAGGGSHVRPATRRHRRQPLRYFQRFQRGRVMSALFAADGARARLIGFNEQWVAGPPCRAPFGYGGAVSCAPIPDAARTRIAAWLDRLVAATGLVGLNGLDFVLDSEETFVLEINPRPTATIDLYDADLDGGALGTHLRACLGELPAAPIPTAAHAHAIVYAAAALRVPARIAWPQWCTDLPEAGSVIAAGAPVCSVHAAAATECAARRLVLTRRGLMQRTLWEKAA